MQGKTCLGICFKISIYSFPVDVNSVSVNDGWLGELIGGWKELPYSASSLAGLWDKVRAAVLGVQCCVHIFVRKP